MDGGGREGGSRMAEPSPLLDTTSANALQLQGIIILNMVICWVTITNGVLTDYSYLKSLL